MNALEDEDVQTKGIVYVRYGVHQRKFIKGRYEAQRNYYQSVVPVKLAGFHFCRGQNHLHDECVMEHVQKLQNDHACRFRIHCGRL